MRDRKTHGYVQLNPKLSTINRYRTPPPAAPPLSALSRGRGGHCYVSTFNSTPHSHRKTPYRSNRREDIAAFPNLAIQLPYLLRICRTFIKTRLTHTEKDIAWLPNFAVSLLYSQPQTLNHRPLPVMSPSVCEAIGRVRAPRG